MKQPPEHKPMDIKSNANFNIIRTTWLPASGSNPKIANAFVPNTSFWAALIVMISAYFF